MLSCSPIEVRGDLNRKNLQRNLAIELCILREIDLTHSAGSEPGDDAVVRNHRVDSKCLTQFVWSFCVDSAECCADIKGAIVVLAPPAS